MFTQDSVFTEPGPLAVFVTAGRHNVPSQFNQTIPDVSFQLANCVYLMHSGCLGEHQEL